MHALRLKTYSKWHWYIYLGREKLRWVDSFKHLGNIVTPDLKDGLDIQLKRGNFFRSVNGLCAKFKKVLISNDVAFKLFQTYCCSFYGSQLWNLSSASFNDICTAWNKVVRRIFHLPFTTHRFLLPCVTQSEHIRANLIKRSTTVFQNMMLSDDEVINFCLSMHISVTHPLVKIGNSLMCIRKGHWVKRRKASMVNCCLYLKHVKILGVVHNLTLTKSTKWFTMYVPCKHEL